jgi:putative ABC transport system permease protein
LTESLGQLSRYLGLIGVFALLLGGIGVASAMRAYMAEKADTIATLRCLGATAPQVLTIYLLQAAAMGLAGAALGVVIGSSVQWVLPRLLRDLLPVEVSVTLSAPALLTGLGLGVWIALAFALIPLLATRRISPLQALRRRVEVVRGGTRDPWTWVAWALLLASVGALVVLQVRVLRIGLGLVAGIGATMAALWLVAWGATWVTRRLRATGGAYPVRQGIANLHRPGNQTRVVVLALGFGVFLIATLYLVQHNLLRPLRVEGRATRANLVFFDVQAEQQNRLAALIQQAGFPVLERTPIVPMRVAAINGRSTASMLPAGPRDSQEEPGPEANRDSQPAGWALRREYRSTFRDTLVGSETLVRGAWWNGDAGAPNGPAPVSLEQDIASDLGVGLGDQITWDVQGVQIPTRVTSIRTVDWARFEPNFFAVFPTQALSGAPHTWVLLARVPSPQQRAEVQRLAVEGFPNVSAVDLTLVQQTLDQVLDRITTVVRFLAGFSIATGFVVLLGAVATSRLQRIRDSVLLRTLGATRRQIGTVLFTEYLLLGVLASLAGIGLAIGAGWALARWLLKVSFAVPILPLAGLAVGVSVLAVLVGLLASRESFRHTPLEMLREE